MDALNRAETTGSPVSTNSSLPDSKVSAAAGKPRGPGSPRKPGIAPHAVQRPFRQRFRLPLKIADGYLLSLVIAATMRGLCWFAGLLFAFAVISAVRRVVADQLPVALMLQLVAYQLPRILLFTLPMSVLYGTVQTFSDLSTRGELTALGVGGMSLPRMIYAPLAWGVMLAVLAFWLQEAVVPNAERKNKEVITKSLMESQGVQEDFLLVDRTSSNRLERVIQADSFDPKARILGNPSIQIYNENKEIALDIRAESAFWDIARGIWVFRNGTSKVTPNASGTDLPLPSVSRFEQVEVSVLPNPKFMRSKNVTINEHLEKRNYEMLSISDLRAYLDKQPELLEKATYPKIQEKIRARMNSLVFGIHDKIATPLICIAVILIAAPLGVRPQRSGGGFAMGLSLAALLVYYITWSWVSQIGKAGVGNPYFLAYLPLLLTVTIGAVLMKLKSR